ncbi:SRPBCC family protein [Fluviicola taffensis]|uniref:SRPBCC family protein n=1 Tax=Fluviicola taffensis TaxID=191579 RepID=UPI003137AF70
MYQLKRTQFVKTDLETCWRFFSAPANLQVITPDYMGFKVLTPVPDEMYHGLIISYKVSPVLHIPMNWVTEITYVKDGSYFVDEQRQGPYKMWHHEHHFKEVEGGVEMTDIVSYSLPFGFLGRFVHWLFVRKQLEGIFNYRVKKVDELF